MGTATGLQGFPLDWGRGAGVGSCARFEQERDLVKVKLQVGSSGTGASLRLFDQRNQRLAGCCAKFLSALDFGFPQLY